MRSWSKDTLDAPVVAQMYRPWESLRSRPGPANLKRTEHEVKSPSQNNAYLSEEKRTVIQFLDDFLIPNDDGKGWIQSDDDVGRSSDRSERTRM